MNRRMNSMRTEFSRILNIGPSGRGADGQIDPNKLHIKDRQIWDRFSFLKDYVHPKKSKSSFLVCIMVHKIEIKFIMYNVHILCNKNKIKCIVVNL